MILWWIILCYWDSDDDNNTMMDNSNAKNVMDILGLGFILSYLGRTGFKYPMSTNQSNHSVGICWSVGYHGICFCHPLTNTGFFLGDRMGYSGDPIGYLDKSNNIHNDGCQWFLQKSGTFFQAMFFHLAGILWEKLWKQSCTNDMDTTDVMFDIHDTLCFTIISMTYGRFTISTARKEWYVKLQVACWTWWFVMII